MHTAQTTAASLAAGVRSEALASAVGHGSSAYPHEFFERLPEFRVEYRVDHRVDEAVHVAQPRVTVLTIVIVILYCVESENNSDSQDSSDDENQIEDQTLPISTNSQSSWNTVTDTN
ncbi:hypothetical protein QTP88_014815 [Uroleucon formosanum]